MAARRNAELDFSKPYGLEAQYDDLIGRLDTTAKDEDMFLVEVRSPFTSNTFATIQIQTNNLYVIAHQVEGDWYDVEYNYGGNAGTTEQLKITSQNIKTAILQASQVRMKMSNTSEAAILAFVVAEAARFQTARNAVIGALLMQLPETGLATADEYTLDQCSRFFNHLPVITNYMKVRNAREGVNNRVITYAELLRYLPNFINQNDQKMLRNVGLPFETGN